MNAQECREISQQILRKEGSGSIAAQYEILDNEIIFLRVAVEDTGTYTISGRNDAGEGSASFVLSVTPPEGDCLTEYDYVQAMHVLINIPCVKKGQLAIT